MRKPGLKHILITLILVGIFVPNDFVFAGSITSDFISTLAGSIGQIIEPLFRFVFFLVQKILAGFAGLAGLILNYVIDFTIFRMRDNLDGLTGINTAWRVIKDLMNIGFIFMLVYQAIRVILSIDSVTEVRKFVLGIFLASILINFSLFFTKVLIDASNVVTIGIYNNIVPGGAGQTLLTAGLANAYTQRLNLQSFYSAEGASTVSDYGQIVGYIGISIVLIIVIFVFLTISILFIVRYIILLALLVLSPIAYMGLAWRGMKKHADKWWESFWGQILWPPAYMIMTWVVLTIISDQGFLGARPNYDQLGRLADGASAQDAASVLVNFALVIGLTIASIVISKQFATQGATQIGKFTSVATSFAGNKLIGGTAWAGRRTVGWAGKAAAENLALQEAADKKRSGIWDRTKGATSRLALYGSKQARSATFDLRNASVPGASESTALGAYMTGVTGLGKGGTKGFVEIKAEKEKKKADEVAKNKAELDLVRAKDAVRKGAKLNASPAEIDAMEQALAKLTAKQTESLVESNRDLLDSQNFANAISVKTLESINKSDKFSDSEKTKLINARFKEINDAMIGLQTPIASRTPAQVAAITALPGKAKGLSDTELELINPNYFNSDPTSSSYHPGSETFVSSLRAGRIDTVYQNKNGQYTSTQISNIRKTRLLSLNRALATPLVGTPPIPTQVAINAAQSAVYGLGHKEIASMNLTDLTNPIMMETYSPALLKKMAGEMKPNDIQTVRQAIETAGTTLGSSQHMTNLAQWLTTADGANFQ